MKHEEKLYETVPTERERLNNIAATLLAIKNLLIKKGIFTEKEIDDETAKCHALMDQISSKLFDEWRKDHPLEALLYDIFNKDNK